MSNAPGALNLGRCTSHRTGFPALRAGKDRPPTQCCEEIGGASVLADSYAQLQTRANRVATVHSRPTLGSAWRDDGDHRRMHEAGKHGIFSWYRIRIAEVERR